MTVTVIWKLTVHVVLPEFRASLILDVIDHEIPYVEEALNSENLVEEVCQEGTGCVQLELAVVRVGEELFDTYLLP